MLEDSIPRKQCEKCPWKKSTDPKQIPDGYCEKKHADLKSTIAKTVQLDSVLRVMACHEHDQKYCIGWLHNQLGIGNNLSLRMKMIGCDLNGISLDGPQHQSFEDTLPK